jgi:hypothetical protein
MLLCRLLSVSILKVVTLIVVMLIVVIPSAERCYAECRYAECRVFIVLSDVSWALTASICMTEQFKKTLSFRKEKTDRYPG